MVNIRLADRPLTAFVNNQRIEDIKHVLKDYDLWEKTGVVAVDATLRKFTEEYIREMGIPERGASFIQMAERVHTECCRVLAHRYLDLLD